MLGKSRLVPVVLSVAAFSAIADTAPNDAGSSSQNDTGPSLDQLLSTPASPSEDSSSSKPAQQNAPGGTPAVGPTAVAPNGGQPAQQKGNEAQPSTLPVQDGEASGAQAPAAVSRNRLVEEIVVTAQKREENIQDVPIAISAFSASKLDAAGIKSTNDLPLLTPGLSITGAAGYSLIYLRGIGTDAFIPSFDPSVATYVDGMYIPSQQSTLTDLGGVERVEVLKGPQGTLFGRNSIGGAINVITKSPGESPELSLSGEWGRFQTLKAKVYASYPLTDTLGVSVAGIYTTDHPYYTVVPDPQSPTVPSSYGLQHDRTAGGRVKVRWRPTDTLEFNLEGYKIRQGGGLSMLEPNVEPSPLLGSLPGLAIHAPGPYQTNENTPPISNSQTTTLFGTGKWSLQGMDVKALGGSQKQNAEDLYDFDGGQPNIVSFHGPNQPSSLHTAELQFVSNTDGFTPHWLQWIAGGYYLHQIAGYEPFSACVNDTGLIPQNLTNILQSLPGLGALDSPVCLTSYGMLETKSISGFVQTTVNFTDWFALTAGARMQRETRFLLEQNVTAEVLGSAPVPLFQWTQPKIAQHNLQPKVTLDFKPIDGELIYLTAARGYKSGSYNIVTLYTPPGYIYPETVNLYEVGTKTSFIPNLTLNAAVFDNEIKNLQQAFLALQAGGAISVQNAEAARTRGGEFDFTWVPLSESDPGLAVIGGASYVSAKYLRYPNASGFDPTTGLYFSNGNYSGNRLARTPRFTSSLTATQTFDVHNGTIEVGGDAYYNGGFNFSPQNGPTTAQKAYTILNARMSYLYQPWGTRVSAYCKNITSEKYAETSVQIDFGTFERLATPRTYGVVVSYDYGGKN